MNGLDYYVAAIWLLAAIAFFWAFRMKQRPQPLSARLQFYAVVAGMVAAVMLLISNLHRLVANGETLTTSRLLAILALLLYAGVQAWQLPRLRAAARAEPVKPSRPRPFFWQGVLILLPVFILSLICLKAIVRDRAFVEEEARQRARDYIATVTPQLGRAIASQLSQYEVQLQTQRIILNTYKTSLPGSREGSEWLTNSMSWSNSMQSFKQSGMDVELRPGRNGGGRLVFSTDGRLQQPKDYPRLPQPPVWLQQLTPDRRAAWDRLTAAVGSANMDAETSRTLQAFLASNPGTNAYVNALFLQMHSRLSQSSVQQAVDQLGWFIPRHGDVLSEAGLPLGNLLTLAVLRRIQGSECPAAVWYHVRDQVNSHPSMFSPLLLDVAEKLVPANPELRSPLDALRLVYDMDERDRAMAMQIQATGMLRGSLNTNLWVRLENEDWFCVIDPTESVSYSSDRSVRREPLIQARYYPEEVVRRAFENALHNARVLIPDYFGFEAQLQGRSFALFNASLSNHVAALSSAGGFLSLPGVLLDNSPFNSGPPVEKPFESLPSHPEFALSVYLADREALFAQHRQRTWWLGAILAVAAGAAVVGFVTARRAYHRQLQLNVMKSNFVSAVSHELRAPIASVRLMAESLERGKVVDAQKQHEYFGFIGQECRRLSALIENVLDFARIEQGRKQYDFEPTNVRALVDQTVKLMEPYAAERKVALRVESSFSGSSRLSDAQGEARPVRSADWQSAVSPTGSRPGADSSNVSAPIHGEPDASNSNFELILDGRALQQALINLLDNAIKHSPDGTTVTVRLAMPEEQAKALTLSVEDHGPGIPQEEHQRIFEQFYRRGSELRRETQGIGIGLSIVKHIVDAHGGRIQVDSAPGDGARFTIELPARPPTVKPEPTERS